jgi:hypothetical protein
MKSGKSNLSKINIATYVLYYFFVAFPSKIASAPVKNQKEINPP